MRIVTSYSHLNGEEYLIVHHPKLKSEVKAVIEGVDAHAHRTKVSQEKGREGEKLFSPVGINGAFRDGFKPLGWAQRQSRFWVTSDERLMRGIYGLPEAQRQARGGGPPRSARTTRPTSKGRVAVEVQFGKYSFVAHDLFVKHLSFYVSDIIDVGIEILPMKEMEPICRAVTSSATCSMCCVKVEVCRPFRCG